MKKILFALPIVLAMACGDKASTKDAHAGHNHSKDATAKHAGADTAAKTSYLTHDPMCDMVKEDSWTLYSVYNGDTVKFCSDYCKKGFDANPAKYAVK